MIERVITRRLTSRVKPQAQTEQDQGGDDARGSRYGEAYVLTMVPTKHMLADEGSYFVTTNPTPSTLIAYGAGGTQTTFSDTVGFLVIKNNASAIDGRRVYLDYLKILVGGTVPATATSTQVAIRVDAAGKDRTPTANSSLLGPVNVNADDSTGSQAQIWAPNAGTITVPAASGSARLVSRGTLKVGISVTLEEYLLAFGCVDGPSAGVAAQTQVDRSPPMVLGPQQFAVIHLWQPGAATNPLSFEFELAHWER